MQTSSPKMLYELYQAEQWTALKESFELEPSLFERLLIQNPNSYLKESLACCLISNPKTPDEFVEQIIQKTSFSAFNEWYWVTQIIQLIQNPQRFKSLIKSHPALLFLKDNQQNNFLHIAFEKNFSDDFMVFMIQNGVSLLEQNKQGKKPFHCWLESIIEAEQKDNYQTQKTIAQIEKLDRWIQRIPFDLNWWKDRPYDQDNSESKEELLNLFNIIQEQNNTTLSHLNASQIPYRLNRHENPMFIQTLNLVQSPLLLEWALKNGLNSHFVDLQGQSLFHTIAQKLASILQPHFLTDTQINSLSMNDAFENDLKTQDVQTDSLNQKSVQQERLLQSWDLLCQYFGPDKAMNVDYHNRSPIDVIDASPEIKIEIEHLLLTHLISSSTSSKPFHRNRI